MEVFLPYNPNGFNRAQLIKDQMLANENRDSSVVLLGGSSVCFGYNSEIINASLKQYSVVNYGLHGAIGLKMNIDDCKRNLKSGDILIVAPEYSHFYDDNAYGGLPLTDVVYLDPLQYLPMLNYRQLLVVLNNTPMHMMEKITYTTRCILGKRTDDSIYSLKSLNKYGDEVAHYSKPHKQLNKATASQGGAFNQVFFDYFIETIGLLEAKGVNVVLFPPPISQSLFDANKEWIGIVSNNLTKCGYHYLVEPSFCCYPDSLFYDTHYHLSGQGVQYHSQRLAEQLLINGIVTNN